MTYLYLHDLLVKSANSALEVFDFNIGAMPGGHNGPYRDPETPVRNTSHWLITFLKAYKISGETKFLDAATAAANYLSSDLARPMGYTFWHRQNPQKDTCNGLMGQAWTIEALVLAAVDLEMPQLLTLAEEVFLMHPFDEKSGLWRCVGVDGTHLDYDFTFNHQLWFAAAGCLLAKQVKGEVESRINIFLAKLNQNFQVHNSGLIHHFVANKLFDWQTKFNRRIQEPLFKIKRLPKFISDRLYLVTKEIGYHSFNLYAFGIIKQQYPELDFWKSKAFNKALNYINSSAYSSGLEDNKYSYAYNPPGFEVTFALEVFFPESRAQQELWISRQFESSYDFEQNMMSLNAHDRLTHAARIYEATRLTNLKIEINSK